MITEQTIDNTLRETIEARRVQAGECHCPYCIDQEVKTLKYVAEIQLKKEPSISTKNAIAILERILANGHGGGNWRRLITMELETLRLTL